MTDLAFRSLQPMTQPEFADWVRTVPADDLHHYELLDGFVVMEPPAGWPHGDIEVRISSYLFQFVGPRSLGQVLGSSQGFELPTGDTVEPDVSFVSDRRWSTLPRPIEGFLRVVPDLVVEILSPGTKTIDRGPKKRIYAQNGVREYWLVDATRRSVELFFLEAGTFDGGRVLQANDTLVSRVLTGFRVAVADMFPPSRD